MLDWVVAQVDRAHSEDARLRRAGGALVEREPTYIVFLKGLANKKREARAALQWAQIARDKRWIACTSATLAENLTALHSASVHSRDNPGYAEPVDGAYTKE